MTANSQDYEKTRMRKLYYQRGFTLIELMIVVAVVAILASIAIPSYNDAMRKSRRAQAKSDMVEYAQIAERHFTVQGSYAGFDARPDVRAVSPREGGTAHYRFNYNVTPTTFTITAVPQGGQTVDRCGTLTIDQTGRKTRSTASTPFNECW